MGTLWQDLRYGLRSLLKRPGFTAVAVVTLAVGVGANTALFSVVNAVLLRPLAYRDADRLVVALHGGNDPVSPADFAEWRGQKKVFEQMSAAEFWTPSLTGRDRPEQLWAVRASDNLFAMLGVEPALGRAFQPGDDQPGAAPVVVLSRRLWLRRFGGDPAVVGQTLTLDGRAHTVVGVMPEGFEFPLFWATKAEMWAPLPLAERAGSRGRSLRVFARLKPGVTHAQAQGEMETIARRLALEHPETNAKLDAVVTPLHQKVVGDVKPTLLVLLGAVGFVLLIVCANVANLLLARASARHREMALRLALGATRGRLVRQLLTENLLLAALGAGGGLLLAVWLVGLFVSGVPEDALPRQQAIGVDSAALAFTALLSLLTAAFFGLAPALSASRTDLNEALKEGGRQSAGGGARGQKLRRLLIVAEVALAMILLAGAGLMLRSFLSLRSLDPGFDQTNLLTMTVSVAGTRHAPAPMRAAFFREAVERVRRLPGVEEASAINHLPLAGDAWGFSFNIEGSPEPAPGEQPKATYRVASPDYFRTMRIPLVEGRAFDERDDEQSPGVVVVNESMARRYWPGVESVGRRIRLASSPADAPWLTVVGVVRDVKQQSWEEEAGPEMYLPYAQSPSYLRNPAPHYSYLSLVVRTTADPVQSAAAVREAVWAIEPNAPVSGVATMDEVVSRQTWRPRLSTLLLLGFALAALILAAVGIYGVLSYSVAQRTHEIGVRMALGAQARDIRRMVVRQGMALAGLGIAAGLAGAFALTRLMSKLLYGVSAADPPTLAAVAILLGAVAFLACYLPARRATRVDPMEALRYE
jgi:predicted permease